MSKQISVVDADGELAAVNPRTGAVHDVGDTGVQLTDIAFAPNHQLYGISFSELYRINPHNGHATEIGPLGQDGMNALTIDAAGRAYAYSNESDHLFRVNLHSGHATGRGASHHASAGDLAFYRNRLVLSDSDDQLLTLDPSNGAVTHQAADHTTDLYGLIATDAHHLYGFAGTAMYSFDPDTGARTLDAQLGGSGLSQIFGAAYDGYFTHG